MVAEVEVCGLWCVSQTTAGPEVRQASERETEGCSHDGMETLPCEEEHAQAQESVDGGMPQI